MPLCGAMSFDNKNVPANKNSTFFRDLGNAVVVVTKYSARLPISARHNCGAQSSQIKLLRRIRVIREKTKNLALKICENATFLTVLELRYSHIFPGLTLAVNSRLCEPGLVAAIILRVHGRKLLGKRQREIIGKFAQLRGLIFFSQVTQPVCVSTPPWRFSPRNSKKISKSFCRFGKIRNFLNVPQALRCCKCPSIRKVNRVFDVHNETCIKNNLRMRSPLCVSTAIP